MYLTINKNYLCNRLIAGAVSLFLLLGATPSIAQSLEVPLKDLSYFKDPGKSWKVAGNVFADLEKANVLEVKSGTGILVNQPEKGEVSFIS